MPSPRLRRLLAVGLVILGVSVPARVRAAPFRIGPGNEQRVLALFAPYALGDEVQDGKALMSVQIQAERIEVTLRDPAGLEARFALRHPADAPEARHTTRSFALVPEPGSEADPSILRLVEVVRRNDQGGFWRAAQESVRPGREAAGARWRVVDVVAFDGLAFFAMLVALSLAVAARVLADAPRYAAPVLLTIVVVGIAWRVALSPPVFLAAWPWSRLYPNVAAIVEGDVLPWVAAATGRTFFVTDVTLATSLAYAALMPLVLFSHASYLMRDARAGLVASALVAVLPQHIRYARAEDGFVASLVLTSLGFALLHGLLRDRARAVRVAYALALPVVLLPAYLLRPLNILFIVVYAGAVLAVHAETAPRARRGVALALVLALGGVAAAIFALDNGERASAITSDASGWAWNALRVLSSPRLFVLDDPTRTPPALMLLAFVGARAMYRAGERRLLGYLLVWIAMFVVAHAVVIVPAYQPRYHMHLVVPFLLLASKSWPEVAAWWRAPRTRPWVVLGGATLALAPLLHVGFVQDIDYAEVREYQAVRDARALIPPRCTVVELMHPSFPHESRMARIAMQVDREGLGSRFAVVRAYMDGTTPPGETPLDTVLADAPRCLFLYEGAVCTVFAEPGSTYARACRDVRARLDARPVLLRDGPNRFYDPENLARRTVSARRVPFRLSRAGDLRRGDGVTPARPGP